MSQSMLILSITEVTATDEDNSTLELTVRSVGPVYLGYVLGKLIQTYTSKIDTVATCEEDSMATVLASMLETLNESAPAAKGIH